MSTAHKLSVTELKNFFAREKGIQFLSSAQLEKPVGLPTSCKELDRYLFWKGLPVSAVSLFYGSQGLGATRLWLRTALPLLKKGQWVAWMNPHDCQITPWTFQQKQCDLSKLLLISLPQNRKEWVWALKETLCLSLFELIGFSMGDWDLKNSQVLKLQKLARQYQTAIVLLSQKPRVHVSPFYSLVLKFESQQVKVERARYRPTPKLLQRRELYADFMPELTKGRQALDRRKLSDL